MALHRRNSILVLLDNAPQKALVLTRNCVSLGFPTVITVLDEVCAVCATLALRLSHQVPFLSRFNRRCPSSQPNRVRSVRCNSKCRKTPAQSKLLSMLSRRRSHRPARALPLCTLRRERLSSAEANIGALLSSVLLVFCVVVLVGFCCFVLLCTIVVYALACALRGRAFGRPHFAFF